MSQKSNLQAAIKEGRVSIVLTYIGDEDGRELTTVERTVVKTALEDYNGNQPENEAGEYLLRLWPAGIGGEVRAVITLGDYRRAKSDPAALNGLAVDKFRMAGPKIVSHCLAVR